MKRYSVLKYFMKNILKESDIAILTGNEMCKEAYQYDRPGNLYIYDDFGLTISLAFGVAMSTDKRVFVFVGEGDLLRDLSAAAQAAVGKCRNLFIILLNNGEYQSTGNQPNIFNSLASKQGFLLNFGFFIHNYTPHFKKKNIKEIKIFLANSVGPLIVFVEVEPVVKKDLEEIKLPKAIIRARFTEVVKNKELKTALKDSALPLPILVLKGDNGGIN